MGKFNLYKIPLKSLPEGTQNYEYHLDDQFFKNIDGPEVQRGSVDVVLSVKRTGGTFELKFAINGIILIPCDRCLDNMDFEVATNEHLYVKFGSEYSEENDDVVIVPEAEGEINIAWFLYEFIALTIPLKHVHPAGKCNKTMSMKLKKHSARSADDGDEDDNGIFDDESDADDMTNEETDPRWDELKKLAHPKRKQSKTRTAKRRTHDKAVAPTLAVCPNCGAWHIYHTVCGECGYYRGKLAIEKEAAV